MGKKKAKRHTKKKASTISPVSGSRPSGYTVKLPTDKKRYTGRDVINLSKGDIELTYNVIAKFVYDEDGNRVDHEDGFEFLIDLEIYEFEEIMSQLNRSAIGDDDPN